MCLACHGAGAIPPNTRAASSTVTPWPNPSRVVAFTIACALISRSATFWASTTSPAWPRGRWYATITRSAGSAGSAATRASSSSTLITRRAPLAISSTSSRAPIAASAVSESDGNGSPAWTWASTIMVLPASVAALRTIVPAVRRAIRRVAPSRVDSSPLGSAAPRTSISALNVVAAPTRSSSAATAVPVKAPIRRTSTSSSAA